MRARVLALAVIAAVVMSVAARPARGQGAGSPLAPTGTLRAVFLGTNPVPARVDARTGAITGPVADLVAELARRLGLPYQLIPAPNAAAVIGQMKAGTADIGFLAYEAARAEEVDFAAGFAVMFSTYLVRRDSPLQTVTDADRQGIRVGAVKGQSQEIYLSANLKQARVQPFPAQPPDQELRRMLVAGELDAFGMNQQRAEDAVAATGTALRVVAGSYLDAEQSFVVNKGEHDKAAELRRFADDVRRSGFIEASIARAKLAGVKVAPAR
jgi:polar amino acid transport system substrate-binding protein